MTKVTKIALISKTIDSNGNDVKYEDLCSYLHALQRETRDLKNNVVRECWEWHGFSNDYHSLNGTYPKEEDYLIITNPDGTTKKYTLDGFIYNKYKSELNLNTSNMSTTIRGVSKPFKKSLKAMLRGDKSVPSYRSNQPLDIKKEAIKLEYDKNTKDFYFVLSLLNRKGMKKYNINTFRFEAKVEDNSTKTILERCYDNIYKISASKLVYKKGKWFLYLSYSFEKDTNTILDPNKILGIDLGVKVPFVASVYGSLSRIQPRKEEIESANKARAKIESRQWALKKQGKFCGEGRIGHGVQTRNKPAYSIRDKIARFRDTTNHKYSREIIKYALKNNCSIIQMEKLEGINSDDKFLKNWSYYDLQTKIAYKAEEAGIQVVYIDPKYTSQRCSKCGAISRENRPDQATFICQKCGFEENADYNASQNIAIQNIAEIINNSPEVKEIEAEKKAKAEAEKAAKKAKRAKKEAKKAAKAAKISANV